MELADKSLHDAHVECQSAGLVGVLVVGVFVLGADLFLLWSPRANADPLASATIDVMTNIGASLRI